MILFRQELQPESGHIRTRNRFPDLEVHNKKSIDQTNARVYVQRRCGNPQCLHGPTNAVPQLFTRFTSLEVGARVVVNVDQSSSTRPDSCPSRCAERRNMD